MIFDGLPVARSQPWSVTWQGSEAATLVEPLSPVPYWSQSSQSPKLDIRIFGLDENQQPSAEQHVVTNRSGKDVGHDLRETHVVWPTVSWDIRELIVVKEDKGKSTYIRYEQGPGRCIRLARLDSARSSLGTGACRATPRASDLHSSKHRC